MTHYIHTYEFTNAIRIRVEAESGKFSSLKVTDIDTGRVLPVLSLDLHLSPFSAADTEEVITATIVMPISELFINHVKATIETVGDDTDHI